MIVNVSCPTVEAAKVRHYAVTAKRCTVFLNVFSDMTVAVACYSYVSAEFHYLRPGKRIRVQMAGRGGLSTRIKYIPGGHPEVDS